jgi:hypothetical protein
MAVQKQRWASWTMATRCARQEPWAFNVCANAVTDVSGRGRGIRGLDGEDAQVQGHVRRRYTVIRCASPCTASFLCPQSTASTYPHTTLLPARPPNFAHVSWCLLQDPSLCSLASADTCGFRAFSSISGFSSPVAVLSRRCAVPTCPQAAFIHRTAPRAALAIALHRQSSLLPASPPWEPAS